MTKKTKKMFEKNKTKTFPFATQNLKKKKQERREREKTTPPKPKTAACCFAVFLLRMRGEERKRGF